jgi:Ca2+/Na+ antiporter
MWKAVLKVIGGLAVLIFSCDLFVDNAVVIAKSFGVDDAFISLTLMPVERLCLNLLPRSPPR